MQRDFAPWNKCMIGGLVVTDIDPPFCAIPIFVSIFIF